jgi:hypothetical protein
MRQKKIFNIFNILSKTQRTRTNNISAYKQKKLFIKLSLMKENDIQTSNAKKIFKPEKTLFSLITVQILMLILAMG